MTAPAPRFQTRFATPLPEMGTEPLSSEPYISAAFFERERERIFARCWLEVGRVEELPNPGDYIVRDLEVLRTEALVVRGADGVIRAFHNVCKHRGMKVATCAQGSAEGFMCNFHGWTYGLDGSLRGVPGIEGFHGLRKEDYALTELACDTWNGFIFVNNENPAPQALREFLGGLGDDLDEYPFDDFRHIARYTARVGVNWKTFVDAFHEAYHAIVVHRRALPDVCCGPENPAAALSSLRVYGPHHSGSVWVNQAHQPGPTEQLAWKYGQSFAPGDLMEIPGLNPSGDTPWWFDINVFFPNFFIDVGPGWYFTYNFWPVSVDESTWEMNIYQLEPKNAGEMIAAEHTKVLLRDLLYEDLSTMEAVHRAMKSGVLKQIPVSDMEIAMRHQYHTVLEWVGGL